MSKDTRLGANPLNWVAQPSETTLETDQSVITTAATDNASGRIFTSAATISEEDRMSESKVKIKDTMETAQVIEHLRNLASSLQSGTLRVQGSEKTVVLGVPEVIAFEMKVSRKKDKGKCSLELEWEDNGSAAEAFKISNE